MRDWNKEIREQMAGIDLPPEMKLEVVAELASHMEESESEAKESSGQKLELSKRAWRQLGRAIYRAKGSGMNRKKSLWIPMFVNLLLTSALINVCDWLGKMDLRIYRADPMPLKPQPWLIVLPLCGAVAAFLARRAEGSSRVRVIAAVAPSAVWFAVPFALEVVFLCFPGTFVGIPLRSLVRSSVWLFVFPGLALLLGAAPFLRTQSTNSQCD
ncbi:MAG TPA: hypothetical protein VMS18_24100 [Candidatus Binatia bacterium]|nr:hypothetical protein [Candidatus Binatia bacterium]